MLIISGLCVIGRDYIGTNCQYSLVKNVNFVMRGTFVREKILDLILMK